MTHRATASPPSSATAGVLPGSWKLVYGRALTLRPPTDGILRVACGRLWATRDGPHGRTPDESGDHVLESGRSMFVRAGERVVVESWTRGADSRFDWRPVPAMPFAVLRQPLADLRTAVVLATRALGALGHGLVQLARMTFGGGSHRRPHGAAG